MRYYRFAYNVFSVFSFVPILWLTVVLPDRVLYQAPAPWRYLMLTGRSLAAILEVAGLLQTDTLSFVGLRQLIEGDEKSSQLITRGLYRWVRHPLYTAGLLFIWLSPVMSANSLTVISMATILTMSHFKKEGTLRPEIARKMDIWGCETPPHIHFSEFFANVTLSNYIPYRRDLF